MLLEATPAVVVTAVVVITSLLAAAALTVILLEATVWALAVKVNVTVPALVTYNPLNVATPDVVVAVCAVVVPFKFPPLVSVAVTVVPLATKLPY